MLLHVREVLNAAELREARAILERAEWTDGRRTAGVQLGELAVFLCSPAGDNVRGVAWQVDGGWTAQ